MKRTVGKGNHVVGMAKSDACTLKGGASIASSCKPGGG